MLKKFPKNIRIIKKINYVQKFLKKISNNRKH